MFVQYPAFYNKIENIKLYDNLSDFLGATNGGIIEIGYLDCVKLAGHSCPTVAAAFIATKVAIKHLYQNNLPNRSEVKITLKEPKNSGVVGVTGMVASYILGSFDEGGFAGIGNKFCKRGLLEYNCEQKGDIAFTHTNTGEKIELNLDTSIAPKDPELKSLMQKSLKGEASKQEMLKFQNLWQARAEFMLLNKQLWNQIAKEIK